ncbi:MAG: hypothetical protein ABI910_07825 [Gemmatimonadota bacterium]
MPTPVPRPPSPVRYRPLDRSEPLGTPGVVGGLAAERRISTPRPDGTPTPRDRFAALEKAMPSDCPRRRRVLSGDGHRAELPTFPLLPTGNDVVPVQYDFQMSADDWVRISPSVCNSRGDVKRLLDALA